MPLQTGQVLNSRYRIVRLLGQGGFGAVYRSWDANLNRPCAVKENLDTSPEAQRQFTREATVLANLSHPNLPRVTDHFILPGQGQYLVMDFVEGEDLATLLQRHGQLPVEQALGWLLEVADALVYLHSRQPPVVHRDIKPANIRITPDGHAMLVDFGLVKLYDPRMRTTMGARAVTPGYAPPEQYGQGATDARTDLYALGATLYHMLTGQEPLESVQRMSGAQMNLVHQVNNRVAPHIGMAIERALRLEPSQRYQNVAEFKNALLNPPAPPPVAVVKPAGEAYARPVAPTTAVSTPPGSRPPSKPPSHPVAVRKQSSHTGAWVVVIILVGLCLLGTLIFGGLYALGQSSIAQLTADAEVQATTVERVRTTSTAQAQATGQALLFATEQARQSYVATLEASRTLVYGPTAGNLEHNTDEMIESMDAGVNLRDFIVEARFFNPYAAATNAWDYGFILRHEAKNTQYRFVIRSSQTWALINNNNDPDGTVIGEGELPDLDVSENGSNIVRLIFQGERGLFYLNDQLISELDLSSRMNTGGIFIVTGVFQGSEQAGSITRFSDFSIWSVP